MIFANIEYLFLLILLIPYIIWYVMKRKKTEPTLQVSTTRMYMKAPKSWKIYLLHAPFVLRTVAIIMVILILARPQTTDNWQNTEIEGIDIMLAVDVSTSMLAEDLKPNRLEAAKQVASEFINGRPNDNIGLTIFAGESFTQCPLTVDHGVLLNLFNGNDVLSLIIQITDETMFLEVNSMIMRKDNIDPFMVQHILNACSLPITDVVPITQQDVRN